MASLIVPFTLAAPLAGQQPDSTSKADTSSAAIRIFGHVTTSFTHSSHALDDTLLVGRAYGRRQNGFMFNVANLTVERVAATDRMSAGFRVEGWLGQNAEVVKSVGLDLGRDADVWQAYAVLNLPIGKGGKYLQLKGGKMATLMGVEVGEDILNPNLEIGYQDIFLEPFTETGIELDGKFASWFDAEVRVSNGWDQVTDVNTQKTVMARLGLTPDDRTLFAVVGYTGPEQSQNDHDRRSGINVVGSRKLTPMVAAQVQFDYGQEEGAAPGGGTAAWSAAGLWVSYDVIPSATLAIRGDYMNDRNGARTSGLLGFPVNPGLKVGSATATVTIKSWPHALLRPELRYDRASLPVFATSKNQWSFALGMSYVL